MSEIETFPGYWRIHVVSPKEYRYGGITVIYTIIYKPGESLSDLLKRIRSKLSLPTRDTIPALHYHSEDGTPTIMKSSEVLDILLNTQRFPGSIKIFDIYAQNGCPCSQEK
jgi:hypothetical protein